MLRRRLGDDVGAVEEVFGPSWTCALLAGVLL
jgi:hypothetical protein